MDARAITRVAPERIHDRRCAARRSDLPLTARREEGAAGDRDRLLARRAWTDHLRARCRNRRGALPRDSRCTRPHHRGDDAQHRRLELVGARDRRPRVLLPVFDRRLRPGDQRHALRADALSALMIPPTINQRDAGLIRAVGTGALAAALVNMVIGAGIFTIPSALAAAMGVYAPLAFVICGIAMAAIAVCFAEGGSRIPSSGGAYGYIEAAFGPLTGFVTGNLLWLSGVLACGAVASALADMTASLLAPAWFAGATHAAVIVGVIGVNAYVSIAGVSQSARLISIATVIKLVPVLLFVTIGVFAVHASNLSLAAIPSPQDIGRGSILALFAYSGMQATLGASGEVAEPA